MFTKKKNLDQFSKEVDQELAKKSPEELAELKKQIGELNKEIAEKKEEIGLFKQQISEIRAASIHQKNLNSFVMLFADTIKNFEKGIPLPPSKTKLFIMQQKYNVKGMHLLPEELEARIIEKLRKENIKVISDLNKKIKTREEEIKGIEKEIDSLKTGKPVEDYKPPNYSNGTPK